MKLFLILILVSGFSAYAKNISVNAVGPISAACLAFPEKLRSCAKAVCKIEFTEDSISKSISFQTGEKTKEKCGLNATGSAGPSVFAGGRPISRGEINNFITFLKLFQTGKPFTYTFSENACCGDRASLCPLKSGGKGFLDVMHLTQLLNHCSSATAAPATAEMAYSAKGDVTKMHVSGYTESARTFAKARPPRNFLESEAELRGVNAGVESARVLNA